MPKKSYTPEQLAALTELLARAGAYVASILRNANPDTMGEPEETYLIQASEGLAKKFLEIGEL